MNLDHLKKLNEPKEQVHVSFYKSTFDEMKQLCEKENVRLNDLLRDIINKFLEERKKDE